MINYKKIAILLDGIASSIEEKGFIKEAYSIDITANAMEYLNYQSIAKKVINDFKKVFNIFPGINEFRTNQHPQYDETKSKGEPGYIDLKNRVLYIDFEGLKKIGATIEDFVAHELGHWLDRYLGNGSYFSHVITPKIVEEAEKPLKNTPHEAFAMMVNFLLVDKKLPGPIEKLFYRYTLEKLKTGDMP